MRAFACRPLCEPPKPPRGPTGAPDTAWAPHPHMGWGKAPGAGNAGGDDWHPEAGGVVPPRDALIPQRWGQRQASSSDRLSYCVFAPSGECQVPPSQEPYILPPTEGPSQHEATIRTTAPAVTRYAVRQGENAGRKGATSEVLLPSPPACKELVFAVTSFPLFLAVRLPTLVSPLDSRVLSTLDSTLGVWQAPRVSLTAVSGHPHDPKVLNARNKKRSREGLVFAERPSCAPGAGQPQGGSIPGHGTPQGWPVGLAGPPARAVQLRVRSPPTPLCYARSGPRSPILPLTAVLIFSPEPEELMTDLQGSSELGIPEASEPCPWEGRPRPPPASGSPRGKPVAVMSG